MGLPLGISAAQIVTALRETAWAVAYQPGRHRPPGFGHGRRALAGPRADLCVPGARAADGRALPLRTPLCALPVYERPTLAPSGWL